MNLPGVAALALCLFPVACSDMGTAPSPLPPYAFEATDIWIVEGARELAVRVLGEAAPREVPFWMLPSDSPDLLARAYPGLGFPNGSKVYLTGVEDGVPELEEIVLLSLVTGQRSLRIDQRALLRVHVVDRQTTIPVGAVSLPLESGVRWEYSVSSGYDADGQSYYSNDETAQCISKYPVIWRGRAYLELSGSPLGNFLLRQEGTLLFGMFASDTTSTSILSDQVHRSLPWRIGDFAAAPGDTWTLVDADTVASPEWPPESEQRILARARALPTDRIGCLAGVFGVRKVSFEVERYHGEWQRESIVSYDLAFADGIGIVSAASSSDSRCWIPGCPDRSGYVHYVLRSYRSEDGPGVSH